MKPLSAVSALVGVLAAAIPALMWIGKLDARIEYLEKEVQSCPSKDLVLTHDSWIKALNDEQFRIRRLEARR